MGVLFDWLILDLATVFVILAGLLYHYLTSTFTYWEKRNVQQAKPELFYGSLKDIITFKKGQVDKFSELYYEFKNAGLKFGGIFQLRDPMILVTSPELVKDISIKDFPYFHDRGFTYDEDFDPLTAHLVSLDGAKWKYLRSKLTPVFTSLKLKGMFTVMRESVEDLKSVFEKAATSGEILDMREIMAQFTTDVIGTCAFGLQLNTLADGGSKFRELGKKCMEPNKTEKILQIVRNVYPWLYKAFKLRSFDQETTDFFVNLVKDTMQQRIESKATRGDFIDFLVKIREAKGANLKDTEEMKGVENYNTTVDENAMNLTDKVLAAQVLIFFLAGFDTSSSSMGCCLNELAQHQDVQDRLRAEVDDMLQRHGGEFTYEGLQELKYMDMVIDETMRKNPTVPFIFRKCSKRYKISGSDVVIDPGVGCIIPTWCFHRDPEYFPEPDKFDPERFSDERRSTVVPHTFIPFGEGPRNCIGMRFSMLEMRYGLAALCSKYKVVTCEKTVYNHEVDPSTLILRFKDGIYLKVEKVNN